MHKVIRIFLDDSKNIVDVASRIMGNTQGSGLIGGMRISGDMRKTYDNHNLPSGYTVALDLENGRIHSRCDDPKVEAWGTDEDEAVRLIIAEIEKALNTTTAITRIEEKP